MIKREVVAPIVDVVREDAWVLLLAIALIGSSVSMIGDLPVEMPIMWGEADLPTTVVPNWLGAVAMPSVALAIYALLVIWVSPLRPRASTLKERILRVTVVVVFCGIHVAVMAKNLGVDISMSTALSWVTGVSSVVLGLVLSLAKPEGAHDRERKVHRFRAGLYVIFGLGLLGLPLVPVAARGVVSAGLIGMLFAGPALHEMRLLAKHHDDDDREEDKER